MRQPVVQIDLSLVRLLPWPNTKAIVISTATAAAAAAAAAKRAVRTAPAAVTTPPLPTKLVNPLVSE